VTKLLPPVRRPSLAKRLTTGDVATMLGFPENDNGTQRARRWMRRKGIAYQDRKTGHVYTTVGAIANLDDGVYYAELMQRQRETG
jgi:hypothetical protein